jgi:hypothetical protein
VLKTWSCSAKNSAPQLRQNSGPGAAQVPGIFRARHNDCGNTMLLEHLARFVGPLPSHAIDIDAFLPISDTRAEGQLRCHFDHGSLLYE